MQEIIEWQANHVFTALYLCWAAEAALYHLYGIPKYILSEKKFGVFSHQITQKMTKLLRGFDDMFFVPHDHYSEIRREDIEKVDGLKTLAFSEEAGIYLVSTCDERQIFMMGHPEYDGLTLKQEYIHDLQKGMPVSVPKNYFPNDDPTQPPIISWRAHANLLYFNWLNYYVYQETPYNLDELENGNSFVNLKWRLG
jgi:homoserine O-succinyltransferase/O-acetyltransferase